jgi:outer membrane protein OmpA-like peptidoglycan-associated protein
MKLFYLLLFFTITLSAQQKQYAVFFDFDKAATEITPQVFAVWAQEHNGAEILKIYGYTDSVGTTGYNQKLSERRAKYILQQLKNNKVKISKSIEIKGFGESQAFSEHIPYDRKVVLYYSEPSKEITIVEKTDLAKIIEAAKKGDKIRLPHLNFYENSTVMVPQSKPVLYDLLAILKEHPALHIQVQGHVCCQPENEEKLSYRRANTVYDYLVENGIDANRLSHTGFGSTQPIYPLPEKNNAEINANRRVEIEIIEN